MKAYKRLYTRCFNLLFEMPQSLEREKLRLELVKEMDRIWQDAWLPEITMFGMELYALDNIQTQISSGV